MAEETEQRAVERVAVRRAEALALEHARPAAIPRRAKFMRAHERDASPSAPGSDWLMS